MTTPTPAGSSAAGMGVATPSPLAILSSTTPRGSTIALSSLQALPETQLVLVLLDHPTVRRKWRAVVVPLVEAISKKLNATYSGSRLMIASVVYRPTTDKSLLRPAYTLSRSKLQPGSKLIASNNLVPESWLGPESRSVRLPGFSHDADPAATTYALIDGRSSAKPTAHLLEAFVAALELLQPSSNGIHNPLAPKKPPVLARHLLHVCLDSTDVTLDLSTPPFFNLDAANDRVNAPTVGGRLARLGVSISSCAVKSDPSSTASTSKEALAAILGLHKSITEPNKLANEDLATLLPEAVRSKIFVDANIISTGLTPPASGARVNANAGGSGATATTASVSSKRGREDEGDATSASVKRAKSGSISHPQPPLTAPTAVNAASSAAASGPSGENSRNIKLDPSISTKVLFLRTQQETMIKNWAAAYTAVSKAEAAGEAPPAKAPGMTKTYLEQLKAQLLTQQQALKMLVQRILSGAETAPNFNVSLHSLINIDKEAREMGVNLGGPSGGGAGLAKSGRSGSLTGGPQPLSMPIASGQQSLQNANGAPKQPPAATAAPLQANAAAPVASSAASGPSVNTSIAAPAAGAPAAPPSPTRPRPFWRGALTWSVISDPVTKQKRDVATLVSATSNSSALDRLMMPWPDKLQITAITQLAPRNLQIYAQTQNAPYILFSTQEAQNASSGSGGVPVLTAATAEKNRQMYSNLASSLDAKKSCAFIRHGGSAGAGLVLFATTQPTSSAERAAKGPVQPKLIGVVLKDTIPFSKLLAAQSSGTAPQQQGGAAVANKPATSQNQSQVPTRPRGASASGPLPQPGKADASPANQQRQQQQQPSQPPPPLVSAPAPAPAAPATSQPPSSGMGLGSSMPFNLAALSAAGNVPVSGIGASTSNLGPTITPVNNPPLQHSTTNLANLGQPTNSGTFGNLANLGNLGLGNLSNIMTQRQGQDAFGGNNGQPNLAALAQLLGIGGQAQAGAMQQQQQALQQQQQQGQPFSQALPQTFGQIGAFQQPQQPQQSQQQGQGLFNNVNPFNVTAIPQQQQQQSGDGSGGGGGQQLDFSKPMTMDQLRALGFIQ